MVGTRKIYDYSAVKLEENVPFPEGTQDMQIANILSKINVGHSFVVEHISMYTSISARAKQSGITLRLRNVGTKQKPVYRVWRIK